MRGGGGELQTPRVPKRPPMPFLKVEGPSSILVPVPSGHTEAAVCLSPCLPFKFLERDF